MRILILGGTAWLSREIAVQAVARGHDVVAFARGQSGPPPPGAEVVHGDRDLPDGYAGLNGEFDAAIDVARQPGHVRSALAVLADRVGHWVFVSTCSVYARHDQSQADESAALLPAFTGDTSTPDLYGEAKVACEEALVTAIEPAHRLIARSGLITGPGDGTDRTGYWPLRFAHPATTDGSVLTPDPAGRMAQLVDVRDLARWLVESAEVGRSGTMNAMAPAIPFADYLAACRQVSGHTADVVVRSDAWLFDHGVGEWSGPRSLPVWIADAGMAAFLDRDATLAADAGLVCRPLTESITDMLAWEVAAGPGRQRKAGLSPDEERELIAEARASSA